MNSIELMVNEHKYIKRMLKVIRNIGYRILKGEKINYSHFNEIIDFVRNYADKHHHKKEEEVLFNRMVEELGPTAEKIISFGMLIEHDLGRFYIGEIEKALEKLKKGDDEARLDIIANCVAYEGLLLRHIEKEDNAVYTFASKNLSENTMSIINSECDNIEKIASKNNIQNKYILVLEKFEEIYL
ncbi:MAG: hemerythrin domain-containing protein [Clostridium sp.]